VITGRQPQIATLLDFERTGWVGFTRVSALLQQPERESLCSGILLDQDGSGMAFYRNQANMTLRAQPFNKCE
jgi:hypothetical protein